MFEISFEFSILSLASTLIAFVQFILEIFLS